MSIPRFFPSLIGGLLLLSSLAMALDGVTDSKALGATAAPYGYLEYLPKGYASAGDWPLVISLHGAGECGNGTSDLQRVASHGPFYEMKSGRDFPAVVLAPQATIPAGASSGWFWHTTVDQFITEVAKSYKIDSKRIYLMGYSSGGNMVNNYAYYYPGKIAAVVPMCPAAQNIASSYAAVDYTKPMATPLWAFHAYDDGAVHRDTSILWVNGIAKARSGATSDVMRAYPAVAGGAAANIVTASTANGTTWTWSTGITATASVYPLMTLYPNGGHSGGWVPTYQSQEMWTWLWTQRVGGAAPAPAPAPAPNQTLITGATAARPLGATAAPYGYLEYLPKDYSASTSWPLIISLHGSVEDGNGTTELPRVASQGPFKEIAGGRDFPAVVLAPQATILAGHQDGWFWYSVVEEFIAAARAKYNIDQQRIYLLGYSSGAAVVMEYAYNYPGRAAAIVPMCTGPSTRTEFFRLAKLPMWSFHAFDDTIMPTCTSTRWIDGIAAAYSGAPSNVMRTYPGAQSGAAAAETVTASTIDGAAWAWQSGTAVAASTFPRLTMFPAGGNAGAYVPTYRCQAMWDWLLAQRNTAPSVTLPTTLSVVAGKTAPDVAVTIADTTLVTYMLQVWSTSSDPTLVPAAGMAWGGGGGKRVLYLTPASGVTGTATVTVWVMDGLQTTTKAITVTVLPGGAG